jgi:putative ABC transport system permease protein
MVGMFLFNTVETLQAALKSATTKSDGDTTLVVYRENRFCPATSRLPEHYLRQIRDIDGVVAAIPIQVAVNNCGASLDVIAFRGVPSEDLLRYNPELEVISGSLETWKDRSDGALVGEHFAARRNLEPGDTFEAVGVRVFVSGIIRSGLPQDNNVAYVHLPFLQQASRVGLGTVTQFNVKVAEASLLEPVSAAIDQLFASDSAPTITRPEKAFFAQTAKDMIEMIGFTRWLGMGAVLSVLGLIANALLLAARSRIKESAVLQTIGYPSEAIAVLVILEGLLLGLLGGVLGTIASSVFLGLRRYTFGNEGLTLAVSPSMEVVLSGILVALLVAIIASLWPAVHAARQPIVQSLRRT